MNQSKRWLRASAVLMLLLAAALLLSACGAPVAATNWAGLSADGQKVYLANGPSVLAYDVDTNSVLWTYPEEPNRSINFYAAPSVNGDRVIVGDYGRPGSMLSPRVRVSVYALTNGSDAAPQGWVNSDNATDKIVAPPLQVGDRVYVGTADNYLLALNVNDGSLIWQFETGHAIWGQPSYRDGVIYISSMDWSAYAIDADSGEMIWQTTLAGALPSQPILGDDLLYVSSYDGAVHALDIASGAEQWQARATDWVWAAPALSDGRLFYGDIDGNIYAVDATTGEPIWNRSTGFAIQSSPVIRGGSVYIASQSGGEAATGVLTAYSVADGQQQWQVTTPTPLFTNPVIVGDDTIVVALNEANALLVGYDLESGAERWRYTPPTED